MIQSWDNVLLPPAYAYGFTGGPQHDTHVSRADGGGESRIQFEEDPKWRFAAMRRNFKDTAGNPQDVSELVKFIRSRRGALYGFLFVNAAEYSTHSNGRGVPTLIDQVIGFGDGVRTRFKIRVQRLASGDNTGRTSVEPVVPLHGVVNSALARLVGLPENNTFNALFAVNGTASGYSATWSPQTFEVIISPAPTAGHQVTWGGYFARPVRFSEETDQDFEASIAGFLADEAPFEVESITNDEIVMQPIGGCPFGAEQHLNIGAGLARTPGNGFLQTVSVSVSPQPFFLWDPISTPTGGPFFLIENIGGTGNLEVRDHVGTLVGTIAALTSYWLFLTEDGSGVKSWKLIP